MSSKSKKQTTKRNAKQTTPAVEYVQHNESMRKQLSKQLHNDAAKLVKTATDKNDNASVAKLMTRLAHAIEFDMPRALKRCEKATRKIKLAASVRSYLTERFATLSKI